MIKKIIASICLLISFGIQAQEGTASPYSFYGIGDIKFKGTAENRAMGGLSIFPDSIHINLQNPAGHAALKVTALTFGATYNSTKLKTNSSQEKATRSSLDYIALGIPMGKFGASFGLMPYSAVGYKIQTISETGPSTRSTGTGGVNKAFLGFGYKINKKLNIGLDINYNFGQISTSDIVFQTDVQYGTREANVSNLSGVNFNAGLMFSTKLKNKYDFFSSLTFSPESNLNSTNERNIATILFSQTTGEIVIDENEATVADTKIKLPTKFAFGAGFGKVKNWLVGTEITYLNTKNSGNRFADITDNKYENAMRYAVGGYYIPRYNSFSSYFDRVTYRGGFRYENTGLVLKNKSINDMALTLGAGLPVGGRFSHVNLGVEFGKRGTKSANLVQENYVNVYIGLSLNDQWFLKRRYE